MSAKDGEGWAVDSFSEAEADPEIREVLARVRARSGTVNNFYRTLAHAESLVEPWTSFAWPLRDSPTVPRVLRELAILRTSYVHGSEYVWSHHYGMGLRAGLSSQQLKAIGMWQQAPSLFDDGNRHVLELTDAIFRTDGSGAFSRRAGGPFSSRELTELAMTISIYRAVCTFAVVMRIPVEPDIDYELPSGWPVTTV